MMTLLLSDKNCFSLFFSDLPVFGFSGLTALMKMMWKYFTQSVVIKTSWICWY